MSAASASPASLGESSRAGSRSHASNPTPSEPPAAESSKRREKEASPPAKKQKFSRSRTACFQCRSRKSKCGAMPPDPCPNCVEADLPCTWPTEDGRSSKARLQRYRNQQMGVRQPLRESIDMKPDMGTPDGGMLAEGWLDRLLAGGGGGGGDARNGAAYANATPGASAGNFPPNANNANPDFMGPNAGVMQQRSMPFSPMTPSAFGGMMAPSPGLFNQFAAPAVDPAQFVWAVSSRLPTVEEASPQDEQRSVSSDPSPANQDPAARAARRAAREQRDEGKIVKVSWWRPHGKTAIAPGLKRYTLKVRVHTPQESWQKGSPQVTVAGPGDVAQELIAPDGAPSTLIMRHLLDVFITHFGCQFPFIDRTDLEAKIESRTASVFLLLSIAAIAARFSSHPAIAVPDLQPYEYGNVFYTRAKAMLGSMLGVPSREAVAAFVLLAHMGFAADSESEVWMMTGLAVRMAIDAGLHVDPPEESAMSAEDRRLNKLVFTSVLLMDYALAFGVGRQTTFRPEDISQTLPTAEDLNPAGKPLAPDTPRSPFPFAAKMMICYGPLINSLNRGKGGDRDYFAARAAAIKEYNSLPADMQWNVTNLQRHARNNQGSIFLHLHLWMHTILASEYLTGANVLRRPVEGLKAPMRSGAMTPNTSAATLWRNSVRTIGDILVLSDIINPHAYFALPFVNQAWFVAGCCYVKEIEMHAANTSRPGSRVASPATSPRRSALMFTGMSENGAPSRDAGHSTEKAAEKEREGEGKEPKDAREGRQQSQQREEGEGDDDAESDSGSESDDSATSQAPAAATHVDMSRALLTSVATTNINTLKSGLEKLAKYWYGAEWIAGTLQQRIAGMHDVDLVSVRENFASYVSLPDAGAARSGAGAGEMGEEGESGLGDAIGMGMGLAGGMGLGGMEMGLGAGDMSGLDFLSLPFDLAEGGGQVTETEVPLPMFPYPVS